MVDRAEHLSNSRWTAGQATCRKANCHVCLRGRLQRQRAAAALTAPLARTAAALEQLVGRYLDPDSWQHPSSGSSPVAHYLSGAATAAAAAGKDLQPGAPSRQPVSAPVTQAEGMWSSQPD